MEFYKSLGISRGYPVLYGAGSLRYACIAVAAPFLGEEGSPEDPLGPIVGLANCLCSAEFAGSWKVYLVGTLAGCALSRKVEHK